MTQITPVTNFSQPSNFKHFSTNFPQIQPQSFEKKIIEAQFNWLTDPTLKDALAELYTIKFDRKDIEYINSLGLRMPFTSGDEVVNFMSYKNVRIIFAQIKDNDVHAHYDYEKNIIHINDKYKGTTDKSVILAIAEAILHEAGHAKDRDGNTTIQEELECLAMNAVAHRAMVKKYSDIFSNSNEPIIKDGVRLYEELFFHQKDLTPLIARVKEKYGYLQIGDDKHFPSQLAQSVKQNISL